MGGLARREVDLLAAATRGMVTQDPPPPVCPAKGPGPDGGRPWGRSRKAALKFSAAAADTDVTLADRRRLFMPPNEPRRQRSPPMTLLDEIALLAVVDPSR